MRELDRMKRAPEDSPTPERPPLLPDGDDEEDSGMQVRILRAAFECPVNGV